MDYALNIDGLFVHMGFLNYHTLLISKLISDSLMDKTDTLNSVLFFTKTHKLLAKGQFL